MALKIANIDNLKNYRNQLDKVKVSYDETINKLLKTIKMSSLYWKGEDGDIFREKLYTLITQDLKCISKEIKAEADYINKIVIVLENTREQVKSRLNG